jgi:predicted nuclease of predicted toxin-antitoxin system
VARLYSNENFPAPVAEELRRLGHDVVSILEHGRAEEGVPDPEVLALAIAEDRAVLTINRRDFIRLHNQNPQHAGIIVCTADIDFVGQAQCIHAAIEAAGDLHGQLIRVNRPQK